MFNALDYRKADHPVEELFVERWSPRAMSGEPLSEGVEFDDHGESSVSGPVEAESRLSACILNIEFDNFRMMRALGAEVTFLRVDWCQRTVS